MGMYDEIYVEKGVKFPNFNENPSEYVWQTRDFESNLDAYKMTEEGKLLKRHVEHEEYTEEDKNKIAQEYGYDSAEEMENEDIFNFMKELTGIKDKCWTECDITKEIEITARKGKSKFGLEFENGQLKEIEKIK